MILTRRGFLKAIVPAAIGGVVLAEEALLHPGRVIFLPPRRTFQNFTIHMSGGHPDIEAIVKRILARDMVKVMDEVAWKTFSQGSSFYRLDANVRGAPKFTLLEARLT